MKQKWKRYSASLLALLLCVTLFASTAFAAGGALGADRNGTPYTYVIGYMYSGSSQTVNTREIFTSPNNYDIWLCPVCGRDPLGNSQGTALSPNLYMPCYGYDIAASGGDMSIRYALVRHRHNNGQLSDDRVYIPVNVPMYAGCYYGYDLTEPASVQASVPTGWQRDSAVVRFSGGTDTGTSLPDWSAAPGDYGSGIHHYEYQINGGAWTGCPVGDPTVTITAGGETTVTARVVDGAGNASGQTATAKVYIDPAPPNVPGITLSTEQWTNSMVTAAIKDNGDAHSGVARTEYSLDGGSWTAYSGVLSIADHGKHVTSGLVVEQAVIRGDAEIKKDQRTRKSPRISGSALIYGTVVGNVSVSGASVVGKGEKIEGGRNSAFLVFFDGDMPISGVNQRKGISQDSHKKQKRKTAHRGGER